MAHNPGDQICDRFQLVRVEPEGTGSPLFGQAWAALDSESGELVRLAILEPSLLADAAARDALVSRLEPLMTGGQDDSLVPLSYIGRDGEHVVAAFEGLYAGISLADVLADLEVDDRLPELGRLIADLALGLALLHGRGLVHGTLGIATIFVWERGNALWQHGLAACCDPKAVAAKIAEVGLVVAPEVAASGQVSAAGDVFAWAATIAAYISGKPTNEAIEALRGGELLGESGELLKLLQAAVDPAPERRPRSGGEIVKGLRDAGLLVVAGEEDGIPEEALMALAEAGLETISIEALPPEVDAPAPGSSGVKTAETDSTPVTVGSTPVPPVAASTTPTSPVPVASTPVPPAVASTPAIVSTPVPPAVASTPVPPAVTATPVPVAPTPVPPAVASKPKPVAAKAPPAAPSSPKKPPSAPAAASKIPAPPKFELPKPKSKAHPTSGPAKAPKLPSLPSLGRPASRPTSAPLAVPPLPGLGEVKAEAPSLPSLPGVPSIGELAPEPADVAPSPAPPLPIAGEPEPVREPEPAPDSVLGDAVAAALGGLGGGPLADLPPPYLPPIGAATEAAPTPAPPSARPAAAVVVKGKRRGDAGDSKTRAKVHLLEPSGARPVGDVRSAETSGIKTATLVNLALAGGRATPSGMRAVDSGPGETSGLRTAVAAATVPLEPSDLAAAVAAATTPLPTASPEPELPSGGRDRRTHPLGWSVEDIESQAASPPPDESSPGDVGAEDSVEARAIVEATTVHMQPGAEEKKKEEDSRSIIILLALAAAVLIAYIFVASG